MSIENCFIEEHLTHAFNVLRKENHMDINELTLALCFLELRKAIRSVRFVIDNAVEREVKYPLQKEANELLGLSNTLQLYARELDEILYVDEGLDHIMADEEDLPF